MSAAIRCAGVSCVKVNITFWLTTLMKELCVVVERAQLRAIVLGREPSTQSCIETPHDLHQERPCTWRSQRLEGRLPHSNSGVHLGSGMLVIVHDILDQDC
eukprot:COSAG02_NODE_1672_length_11385_cov_7.810473_4_plen_101_part_00